MTLELFKDFFARKGYQVQDTVAYGTENGYPVLVHFIQKGSWQYNFTAVIDDFKQLKRELKGELSQKYPFAYTNGHLSFVLRVGKKDYEELCNKAAEEVTGALHRHCVRVPNLCPICKQAGCDSLVINNDGYDPVHKNCMVQVMEGRKDQAVKSMEKGNYVTGFIGALIGMLAGTIPSVISILAANYVYAILFALIPLCTYYGYKLLRGKMNKAALVITIILSVISVYVLEIVLLTYYFIVEEGISFSYALSGVFYSLSSADMWVAMTQDSITSFVFIALGIWIAWGKISRTGHTELRSAEQVMQTLAPYGQALTQDTEPESGDSLSPDPFESVYSSGTQN